MCFTATKIAEYTHNIWLYIVTYTHTHTDIVLSQLTLRTSDWAYFEGIIKWLTNSVQFYF